VSNFAQIAAIGGYSVYFIKAISDRKDNSMLAMHGFIERQNIARFIDQINAETDPAKRAVIIKLLSEEEAKLASHNRK